jgi:hypothetical protein
MGNSVPLITTGGSISLTTTGSLVSLTTIGGPAVNRELILQTRYNNKFKVLVGLSRTNTRNPVANESNDKPDYSLLLLIHFVAL